MKRSLSTHNPYEIGGCEAADRLESRMKESTGISARTVPELAELKWLGRCTKNESLVFHQAVHRSHSILLHVCANSPSRIRLRRVRG